VSDTEDDLLFRIGFESHPQAGSKLEALAQAVEMTQKRIDQMFTTTADRVAKAATTMQAVVGKTSGGGSDSGESAMRSQLKQTADAFQQQTDRLVALQSDMVSKLDAIRQKDVSSADGHAKRLEAIYANTLANLNAAVAGAKAGTGRVQVAVGGGGDSGMGSNAMQSGASQLEAMAAARQATHQRIIADTQEFNTSMELAAGHEILTLEQRNEGAALFARARAAIERGAMELHRQQLADDREASQFAIEQLRKDLQLVEDIQAGGGGSAFGASEQDAFDAAERVKAYYDTVKKGQEQAAAEESKAIEQQIKNQKKLQDEQDRANRNRRRLIENSRRIEEQMATQAQREAAKAASDQQKLAERKIKDEQRVASEQDRANRNRRKLIENTRKAEEQAEREAQRARDVAAREEARLDKTVARARELWVKDQKRLAEQASRPWLDAYADEVRAASQATRDIQRGRQALFTSFEQTAGGIGKLTRSAVLLGLANGEEMEKVIRQLALVQAGVDLIGGTVQVVRGAANAFEGLRLVIGGKIAAQRAATAAGAIAVQGSVAVQNALNMEALSANRAAAAHVMLARSRSGGAAMQTPIVPGSPVVAGSTRAGGRGGMVAMGVGAVAGGFGGAMAGGAVGERLGGEQGQAIGTVIGTVAGGIIGPMVAAAVMRGRVGGALSGGIGGILGRAGGLAGGAVMGGAGSVAGGLGIGVGGGAAMVGGAALAALTGSVFALKSTIEVFKDASKNGLGGGSQQGSFNDTVGGSRLNPFSFFIAWNERAELAQNEEKTKRMENASVLLRMEQQHLRDLQAIRIDFARQSEAIDRETNDAIFNDRFGALRTPTERADAMNSRSEEMQMDRDRKAQALMGFTESDGKGGMRLSNAEDPAAQKALDDYIQANERLIETEKQREQVLRQVAAEARKGTMDQIKGIEDVIRARMKESSEIEKMMMTARARFGQMTEFEQEMAKQAFQRVKAQGANADRMDIDQIRNIGTDETNRLVKQFDQAQGRKAGFDQAFGGDAERRQRAIEQANQKDAGELGRISGQDPNKILENASKPVQIDLVDRTQLEITLNNQEDELFNRILAEVAAIREENAATRKQRLQEAEDQKLAQQGQDFRQRQEESGF
jgi:hypothetical protein